MGWFRSVIKYMPQMGVTATAQNLYAHHPVARVSFSSAVFWRDRRPKAWPACARIKLGVGAKQVISTTDTLVYSLFFQVVVLACERSFRPFSSGDPELLRREFSLPLFIGLNNFVIHCRSSHPTKNPSLMIHEVDTGSKQFFTCSQKSDREIWSAMRSGVGIRARRANRS